MLFLSEKGGRIVIDGGMGKSPVPLFLLQRIHIKPKKLKLKDSFYDLTVKIIDYIKVFGYTM